MDGPTAAQPADAFREFEADPGAAVAVLRGEGGAFRAGDGLRAVGTARGDRVRAEGDGAAETTGATRAGVVEGASGRWGVIRPELPYGTAAVLAQ